MLPCICDNLQDFINHIQIETNEKVHIYRTVDKSEWIQLMNLLIDLDFELQKAGSIIINFKNIVDQFQMELTFIKISHVLPIEEMNCDSD